MTDDEIALWLITKGTMEDKPVMALAADRILTLRAERDRLREALVVLADDSNWFSTYDLGAEVIASWRGNGEPDDIARAALKGETP